MMAPRSFFDVSLFLMSNRALLFTTGNRRFERRNVLPLWMQGLALNTVGDGNLETLPFSCDSSC